MAGRIAVAVGLVGLVSAFAAAQGCGSTSAAPGACTGLSVKLIQASDYDQSCTVDTDCRYIAEGNACTPCAFDCSFGAINVSALAQYNSDIANTPAVAAEFNGQSCASGCPAAFGPCCIGGKCQTSTTGQCPGATADAGDAGAGTGADADGPAACVAAGGECLVGGSSSVCAVVGPQDCNPDRNPGGQYCCLKKAGAPDAAPESGADADACAPSGCSTACPAGTQDVSSMVNGCLVWQCCVTDDASP